MASAGKVSNKTPGSDKQKKVSSKLFVLSVSLSPFILLLFTLHTAFAEGAERTSVRVVWCLGSLGLLEPSRKTQTMPVGCTPFLSSRFFFSPSFSLPLFFFSFLLSLKYTQTAPALTISLCSCCTSQSLICLPPSSHTAVSRNSVSVPLRCSFAPSGVPLGRANFFLRGLPKGARGERKVFCSTCLSDVVREQEASNKDA